MAQQIENVERPIALVIMTVVLTPFIFFGIRHVMKVREAAKREEVYQSTLRTYQQVLNPGTKRKEVEEYFRLKNIEFSRLSQEDLIKIGEDDSLNWFCGKPDVFVQFRYIALPRQERQMDADGDSLEKIEIIRRTSGCV